MNYAVEPRMMEDNTFLWSVYEPSTRQYIMDFFFEDEAKAYARFVSNGGAFNGWTPPFMLRKVKIADLNQEFTEIFEQFDDH